MTTRIVERLEEWDTVPFDGGYGGLHALAADEFSGVVTAGVTQLFMLQGTVVGIEEGTIEDFEDAAGTARRAPHHALPLLAVMQERADEVRAKYYTEDTPMADVDRKLSEGNFTGYVELAENVLSGDYFNVYHQGRSMSVAYVGASMRLITDDEAFDTADDEVGIFEVKPVEIEPIEIPEADDGGAGTADETAAADAAATDAAGADDAAVAGGDAEGEAVAEADVAGADAGDAAAAGGEAGAGGGSAGVEPGDDGGSAAGDQSAETTTGADDAASADATATDASQSAGAAGTDAGAGGEPAQSNGGTAAADAGPAAGGGQSEPPRSAETRREGAASGPADGASGDPTATAGQPADGTGPAGGGGQSGGATSPDDLEMRTIPSLDPNRSASTHGGPPADAGGAAATSGGTAETGGQSGGARSGEPAPDRASGAAGAGDAGQSADGAQAGGGGAAETGGQSGREPGDATEDASPAGDGQQASGGASDATEGAPAGAGGTDAPAGGADAGGEEASDEELEAARERIERLEQQLEGDAAGDDVGAGNDAAGSGGDAASGGGAAGGSATGSAGGQALGADRAIDETNLFVRYDSKGEATLEKAHDGDGDREAVAANLRLEYHTQFDAAAATVNGEPFEDFLTGTIQYRFVEWLVTSLLWEIRETGHTGAMSKLYDALPKIDRAELNGEVSVEYVEDGEQHRSQQGFDVVVRDRMGNPLLVADINASRDPASEDAMTDLVRSSQRVGESSASLAAAALVTQSFFEPEALETAEEATSSGLFSRDKRKSFVNLSRKDGYHLCLIEARNEEIHLTVPEL